MCVCTRQSLSSTAACNRPQGGRHYPEFCTAGMEPVIRCHWIRTAMAGWKRWDVKLFEATLNGVRACVTAVCCFQTQVASSRSLSPTRLARSLWRIWDWAVGTVSPCSPSSTITLAQRLSWKSAQVTRFYFYLFESSTSYTCSLWSYFFIHHIQSGDWYALVDWISTSKKVPTLMLRPNSPTTVLCSWWRAVPVCPNSQYS